MKTSRIAGLSLAVALVVGAATATAQHMFADFGGVWNVTVEGPQGPMNSQLTLTQKGDSISGDYDSEIGKAVVTGTAKGDTLRFGFGFDMNGQQIVVQGTGVLSDKKNIAGNLDVAGMGGFPFRATKRD